MGKTLRSYTNLYTSDSDDVPAPSYLPDLKQVFQDAQANGKNITFAAGMSSFDSQFLNDDIVVHMKNFRRITIDEDNQTLTAEPGAQWGDVFERLTPLGLTMYSTVTTKAATVGGTLSGNCLSQTSLHHGKEGHHIIRLKLLTIDGDELVCSETENPDVFKAVIGGFGWLGAVTEATYKLRDIGDKIRIKTRITKHAGFQEIIDVLEQARAAGESVSDTAWATAFLHGEDTDGMIFREKYTDETEGEPFFYFQPDKAARMFFEALGSAPGMSGILSRLSHLLVKHESEYLNELHDNIFFMDANRNYKKLAALFGIRIKTAQQTYVTPVEETVGFLEHAAQLARDKDLVPSAIDTLYIPEDDVLLSSNNGLSGYANTMSYEGIWGAERLERIKDFLAELNDECHARGGRLYLVKNVFVDSQQQIADMYGQQLTDFLAIKSVLDPNSKIRNDFFDKVFGA